jgi:DNA-3-methyladenine glycosylase II
MDSTLAKAAAHIAAHDPILAPIIASASLPSFTPHTDYYQALVDSIIGQQLSVKAAATIRKRFVEYFNGLFPSPEQILNTDIEQLRSVGLSRSKATYIQDLARHVLDGTVQFTTIDTLSNEAIIQELTAVKGIGVWTVHMFLMFCMGRMDVLPIGDLGIRNGVKNLYGLENIPTPDDITAIAAENGWSPYESVASWYIWHSLDNAPKDINHTR